MTEESSIDDILDFAIEREIEANQFYQDLAGRVRNPAMRKVFEDFAREELGHKARLETMKADKTAAPSSQKVSDLRISDYVVDIDPEPDMDYQDALILAMKKEKAACDLYTELAQAVEDNASKDILLSLAQQEAKHKLRFEREYDDVVLKEN